MAFEVEIEESHKAACEAKQETYVDPATGYTVMTEWYLKSKQECCGNKCRHCPYAHTRVSAKWRNPNNKIKSPVFLKPSLYKKGDLDSLYHKSSSTTTTTNNNDTSPELETLPPNSLIAMFWSGGKDSFLALTHTMQRINPTTTQIVLLTTIDPETNKVPIQNVSVPDICAQASALNLPLLLAPRGPNAGNETYIQTVTAGLCQIETEMKAFNDNSRKGNNESSSSPSSPKIKFLVFGDLFLQDIRSWRETSFGSLVPCRFPLFGLDYKSVLLPRLWRLCEEFEIKIQFAVFEKEEFRFWVESVVEKGDEDDGGARSWPYTKELLERSDFPENVDLMGERGEFHTLVQFLDMWDKE